MTEEIFDVVNERDEVVGQCARSEVHALGLLHRAAHILVFNAQGEVFLQKRSLKKDRQAGLWDSSASGHLHAGENYDACAIRELAEELGLAVTDAPRRLFKLPASAETDQEHVWVYECASEGPFSLDAEEISEGRFVPAEDVTTWVREHPDQFASAFRVIWSHMAQDRGLRSE